MARTRADELATLDPSLRSLQQAIWDQVDANEALANSERLAGQSRSLETKLLEVSGDKVGALARLRADELAALDPSLRGLQQAIWDKVDANEALAESERLAGLSRSLETKFMEVSGDKLGALARVRADELAALDPSLHGLQQAIWDRIDQNEALAESERLTATAVDTAQQHVEQARNALAQAYERESGALKETAERFKGFAAQIRGFREGLGDAGATPAQQLARAQAQFRQIAARARLGDEEALGQFTEAGEAFKRALEANAASPIALARGLAEIRSASREAEATADRQAGIAEQQLAALTASVAGLIQINGSVLSVGQAVAELGRAMQGLQAANPGRKWGANPVVNAALAAATGYAGDFGSGGWQAWIVQQDEATKAKAREILGGYGQFERIVGFKTGGGFEVGGFGGTDSQLMRFRATPGEMVNITHGDTMAALAEEVRALRSDLNAANAVIAQNTRISAVEARRYAFERRTAGEAA